MGLHAGGQREASGTLSLQATSSAGRERLAQCGHDLALSSPRRAASKPLLGCPPPPQDALPSATPSLRPALRRSLSALRRRGLTCPVGTTRPVRPVSSARGTAPCSVWSARGAATCSVYRSSAATCSRVPPCSAAPSARFSLRRRHSRTEPATLLRMMFHTRPARQMKGTLYSRGTKANCTSWIGNQKHRLKPKRFAKCCRARATVCLRLRPCIGPVSAK
mmetsp:Transcript_1729/g.2746  ORF Transcript_1729/g.2746 Transcript_1729/m.2746 type:complete len:220 (+) Transcript_1729:171-830(+)